MSEIRLKKRDGRGENMVNLTHMAIVAALGLLGALIAGVTIAVFCDIEE